MSSYIAARFGQDTAPRIAATATVLMEASELAPIPTYQPIIPFYPSIIDGSGGSSGGNGNGLDAGGGSNGLTGETAWKQYPDRFDIYVYQGDDVQIPLYFQNPVEPDSDMSTDAGYVWKSQVRYFHRYYSQRVSEFTITTEYTPPDTEIEGDLGTTLVSLYMPRFANRYTGVYSWDLQSTSPFEGPEYPPPEHLGDGTWPLTDQLRTWLYGRIYIVPRVTTTDYLPLPPNAYPNGTPIVVTYAGGTAGPNGRVP